MFRYSFIADQLLKALTHKYVRRVPKGVTKTGATKYVYYYAGQEGHGHGVAHESELVQGASFAFGEHGKSRYHAHITKVDGDKLTIKYDDGDKKGKEETMTKKQFQAMIHGEHSQAIKQAQSKAEKQLQEAKLGKEKGVKFSDKTMSKLEERVKTLQGLTPKQEQVKQEEKKKTTPKKTETSKDDIVKNVTTETIGKVLDKDLLNVASTESSRRRLTGINVNLESKKFEATNGHIMKSIDFPEGFKVDIVGSKEFENNTCCIPPKLVKTMAKHAGSTIEFNTDNYNIILKDKDGNRLEAAVSVGEDGFPDIDKLLEKQYGKADFSKNTLTFSNSDKKLLKNLDDLGFSNNTNNVVKFIAKKDGGTELQIDAFSSLPRDFQDTKFRKIDAKKLVDAIQNMDGITIDRTYNKNKVYLVRNKKTNEIIGVGNKYKNETSPDFLESFEGLPSEAQDLLTTNDKVTFDSHPITFSTDIKSNMEEDTTRTFNLKYLSSIAESMDKLTLPKNEYDASQFTNDKNVKGLLMPTRG